MLKSAALLSVVLSSVACERPPTELVVVVDTDLEIPSEVASVRMSLIGADGLPRITDFFLGPGEEQLDVPFSFVVAPEPGTDESRQFSMSLEARAIDHQMVLRRTVSTGFVVHRRLGLPLFLAAACASAPPCGVDMTCTERGCVSTSVPPETLDDVEPGSELVEGP